jgi:hypothetical protein
VASRGNVRLETGLGTGCPDAGLDTLVVGDEYGRGTGA